MAVWNKSKLIGEKDVMSLRFPSYSNEFLKVEFQISPKVGRVVGNRKKGELPSVPSSTLISW